jgi:serine/threonine-protein kinase
MGSEGVTSRADRQDDATRLFVVGSDGKLQQAVAQDRDPLLPALGRELGPVRLIRELGRGAMAVVFLAHHKRMNREVAVKVLTAGTPESRSMGYARFAAEAQTAAAVQDEHLIVIYRADLTGEVPYLVMEYVKGPTLGQLVRKSGKLSESVTAALMLDVAGAVAKLHQHDIIHRDLKLSNVLLDTTGRAVVSDFGLAELHAGSHSAGSSERRLAGTPAYMAPEMFAGDVSTQSDVYALGIMMFHMLTGKVPFQGTFEEVREQHQQLVFPIEMLAGNGANGALQSLITQSTHKDPTQRFSTARELRQALAGLSFDPGHVQQELVQLIATETPDSVA